MRLLLLRIATSVAACLFLPAFASAQVTTTWVGGVSGDWHDTINWSPSVPGPADTAVIPAGTPNNAIVFLTDETCGSLVINAGAVIGIQQGRRLTVNQTLTLNGQIDTEPGCELQVGGNFTASSNGVIEELDELVFFGDGTFSTGTALMPPVRVIGGVRSLGTGRCESLFIDQDAMQLPSRLHILNAATFTVEGDAHIGEVVTTQATGASVRTLQVNGTLTWAVPVYPSGLESSSFLVVRCNGDYEASTPNTIEQGWVELGGAGTQVIRTAFTSSDIAVFRNLRIIGGTRLLENKSVLVLGECEVRSATFDLDWPETLEVRGTLDTNWPDALITNDPLGSPEQPIRLTGAGDLRGGANVLPDLLIDGGQYTNRNATVSNLTMSNNGSVLTIANATTLHVTEDYTQNGGTLAYQATGFTTRVLRVDGAFRQFGGDCSSTLGVNFIDVYGDWSSVTSFVMDNGWVRFKDSGQLNGVQPHIRRMRLDSGVRTVVADVEVSAELQSIGGSTDGGSWIEMTGTTSPVSTGANLIKRLRVVANTVEFSASRIEQLEMTGGVLRIRNAVTLTVDGDVNFTGGQLTSQSTGATLRGLDVAGNCTILGATAGGEQNAFTLHRVAGNWTSDGGFSMPAGWFTLDGAGSTTIGGPAPTFGNVRIENGTRTLISGLTVEGELEVRANLDAADQDVEVQGNLDTNWSGATFVGTGPVRLTGDGELRTTTNSILPVRLESGTRQVFTSRIDGVEVTGGTWRSRDASMCTVSGDVTFTGGTHSSDPAGGTLRGFDIAGDFTQTGAVIGTTNFIHRVSVEGNWSSEAGFSFADGWVYLDGGDATIGGGDPEFKRLRLVSGTKTLVSDAEVYGELVSVGGSTDGTGWMELTDALTPVSTGANSIGRLRVVSNTIPFFASRVGDLEMTGGVLLIRDAATLTVDGDATFTGGELASQASGGTLRGLDVAGDCTILGATSSAEQNFATLHRVAGDWSSDDSFAMSTGWFTLDGAGSTTIGGPSPTFGNLRIENGTRTLTSATVVEQELEVRAALDAADQDIEIQGTLDTNWSGATFVGTGPARLTGNGELRTTTNSILPVRLESGQREVFSSRIDSVEVTGGTWVSRDAGMCTVSGDVLLTGGVLSSQSAGGTLRGFDVAGSWTQTGTSVGTTNFSNRISVAGDWSSTAGFTFDNGWVYLDGGDSTLGGAGAEFNRLRLEAGVNTLTDDVTVFGQLFTSTGSTAGDPWMIFTGSSATMGSGDNLINRVRVASGSVPFSKMRIGDLQVTGGTMTVNDAVVLTVERDVELLGGVYQTQAGGGTPRGLDVAGNFTSVGTTVGTENFSQFIRVEGDWSSNSTFAPTSGVVELDGAGTSVISGSLPGLDPSFPTLRLKNGTRQASGDVTVNAALLDIDPGSRLECPEGSTLRLAGTPVTVDGSLGVLGGGALLGDGGTSLTVNGSGLLEVLGNPGQPARLGGHAGGGYACTVAGTLAARNFDIGGGDADGLRLTGSLAPAPDDLRGGLFRDPAPSAGAALLTLQQSAGISPLFVTFENASPAGQVNVRRTAGSAVTFGNFGGDFAGEDFEDDPNDLVDWVPGLETQIDFFEAKNGPEKVFLSWSTNLEVNVERFVIESGPTALGPFAPVGDLLAQGSGAYALTDEPLTADVERHYRLLELQNDGFLRLLATDSATPYSAALPANIRTVGPGLEFATIQEAIDAVSDAQTIVRIAAGTYPAFTVDAPPVANVTLVPEPGANVVIDASAAPVIVRNLILGQDVTLADLTINGGSSAEAVRLEFNQGAVILDQVVVAGGAGQAGLTATGCLGVSLQGGQFSGSPGVAGATSGVYLGRTTVDTLDLSAASVGRECQNTLGATAVDGTSTLTSYAGVQPELAGPRFATLGQPVSIDLQTTPNAFYQLGVAGSALPLDLQDPGFWQMVFLLDFSTYSVLVSGFTDGAGAASLDTEVPPQANFLGSRFLLQAWTLQAVPTAEVRFSGALPVVAVP